MSDIRFRDSSGKVHEFKDVRMSTQILDRNGVEIWEGDTILSPAYDKPVSKKRKKFMVQSIVEFRVRGPNAKTVSGSPIAEPIEFMVREVKSDDRNRACYNWSEFFECEVVNVPGSNQSVR